MANALKVRASQDAKTFSEVRPVIRTDRPFAYDLADAYNRGMPQEHKDRGLVWIVWGPRGAEQVKLVTDDGFIEKDLKKSKSAAERDRKAFNNRTVQGGQP